MAHPALDNPSCQSLAARIPATCMQQLSELMIVAQSVSDRLCDDAATAPLFGHTGMVMQAVKCLVDVPEFADLVPFSNVLSRATVRRIFCDADARVGLSGSMGALVGAESWTTSPAPLPPHPGHGRRAPRRARRHRPGGGGGGDGRA